MLLFKCYCQCYLFIKHFIFDLLLVYRNAVGFYILSIQQPALTLINSNSWSVDSTFIFSWHYLQTTVLCLPFQPLELFLFLLSCPCYLTSGSMPDSNGDCRYPCLAGAWSQREGVHCFIIKYQVYYSVFWDSFYNIKRDPIYFHSLLRGCFNLFNQKWMLTFIM